MDCPKCGAKAEDYAVYCPYCGVFLTEEPGAGEDIGISPAPAPEAKPPRKVAQRLYPPKQDAAVPEPQPEPESSEGKQRPSAPTTSPRPAPAAPTPGKSKPWLIVLAVTAILCAIFSVYVLTNTHLLRVELTKAQTERASVQASTESLGKQVAELESQLETALDERNEYSSEVTTLKSQLNAMESSVSQSTYDKASAERELSAAQDEIEALTGEITELTSELTETKEARDQAQAAQKELQAEYDALKSEHKANQDALGFYDTYVVFVMLDSDTKYYHKYDCADFTKRNFLAYSTKLAEANGYSGCPKCTD